MMIQRCLLARGLSSNGFWSKFLVRLMLKRISCISTHKATS